MPRDRSSSPAATAILSMLLFSIISARLPASQPGGQPQPDTESVAGWSPLATRDLSGFTICVDPGHGGSDCGATGYDGSAYPNEEDFTLDIALTVRDLLQARGATVVMTRTADVDVSLQARCDIANNANADRFVSIHCNSHSSETAHGTETYWYTSGSADSQAMAAAIQSRLVQQLGLFDRGVKQASYYVLAHTTMPAALAEVCFISNQDEFDLMNTQQGRDDAAWAIYAGICDHYSVDPNTGGDTTPPTVTVTAPAAGSEVSGTVHVVASISDDVGVASARFRVNQGSWQPLSAPPWAWDQNLRLFEGFSVTLTVEGFDAAGNVGSGSVTVSVVPPGTAVAPGVVHEAISVTYGSGPQQINVLDVDLSLVEVKPALPASGTLARTSAIASARGAIAAVNGGYFDANGPLGLVQIDDQVLYPPLSSKPARSALGIAPAGAVIERVDSSMATVSGYDWGPVVQGLGAGPNLLTGGVVDVTDVAEELDSISGLNPRTAVGITPSGHLKLVTVDGRQTGMTGMTFTQLANYMYALGCVDAFNLDGGGSTTMWVSGRGVVNSPSDPSGERAVADALLVLPRTRPVVTNIRYATLAHGTEVIADLDIPTPYTHFALTGPNRIVVDLSPADRGPGLTSPIPVGDGVVSQVRFSQFDADTVRIVADLALAQIPAYTVTAQGASVVLYIPGTGTGSPPVAMAGLDQAVTLGTSVTLDGGASFDPDGTVVSYDWDLGDGSAAQGPTVVHTYSAVGEYAVTLTVTDNDGLMGQDVLNVSVTPVPNLPPVADAGSDRMAVVGQIVVFDGGGSYDPEGGALTYTWEFGDGATGSGVRASHDFASPGNYTVILTVTDPDGLEGMDACLVHAVMPASSPPVADAGPDLSVVLGEAATLDGRGSYDPDGTVTAWAWDLGDGSTATGPVVNHIYATAGTFTVALSVTDDQGLVGTDQATVTVAAGPLPPVADAGSHQTAHRGEAVFFDGRRSYDPDGQIVSWSWEFGDGGVATGAQATHVYAALGNYTATLRVIDSSGLVGTDATTVRVVNKDPWAYAGPDRKVHVGASTVFDGQGGDDDGEVVRYLWSFGDGAYAEGRVVDHPYASVGGFDVVLRVEDNDGGWAEDHAWITVVAGGPLPPVADAGPDLSASVGAVVQFGGASYDPDGTIVAWHWEFGDGTAGEGERVEHAYSAPGVFTVLLQVTDDQGLVGEDRCNVTVVGLPPIADAGPDLSARPGEVVTLDGSGSYDPDGRIVSWSWDFGDGASAHGATAAHAYNRSGTYVARLTVTDDTGAEGTDTAVVLVRDGPLPPVADAGGDRTVDALAVVRFISRSYDPDGAILRWGWTFGDGGAAEGEAVDHVYLSPGSYEVVLTVEDDAGLVRSDAARVMVLSAPPIVDLGRPRSAARGESVRFEAYASDPDGVIVNITWDFDDGTVGYGPVVEHAFFGVGVFVVRAVARDDAGREGSGTVAVTVVEEGANRPPVAWAVLVGTALSGQIARFDGSGSEDPDGTIAAWRWEFGDGGAAEGARVNHTYAEPGRYNVTLRVWDDRGAASEHRIVVDVQQGPLRIPPVAAIASAGIVVAGSPLLLDGSGSYDPDGAVVDWSWRFGDGTEARGQRATHAYADPGSYEVVLVVTDDSGLSNRTVLRVTVTAPGGSNGSAPVKEGGGKAGPALPWWFAAGIAVIASVALAVVLLVRRARAGADEDGADGAPIVRAPGGPYAPARSTSQPPLNAPARVGEGRGRTVRRGVGTPAPRGIRGKVATPPPSAGAYLPYEGRPSYRRREQRPPTLSSDHRGHTGSLEPEEEPSPFAPEPSDGGSGGYLQREEAEPRRGVPRRIPLMPEED